MTLCIAKRLNECNVELISDSRFTLRYGDEKKYFDTGIKVIALPITFHWPFSSKLNEQPNGTLTYGLAIAGDTLHTYLVKEALQEVLGNLAVRPGKTDVSIERICELIRKIFIKLAQDVDSAKKTDWKSGFFFTGYCMNTGKVKAFKFDVKRSRYGVGGEYKEILQTMNAIDFIGSGDTLGRQVYEQHPNWKSVYIIDEVIRSKKNESVGGYLQYGSFVSQHDFRVKSVCDYELDENGFPVPKIQLRGTDYFEGDLDDKDFVIKQNVIDPFRTDCIESFNKKHSDDPFTGRSYVNFS